jgi:hypothetical protein
MIAIMIITRCKNNAFVDKPRRKLLILLSITAYISNNGVDSAASCDDDDDDDDFDDDEEASSFDDCGLSSAAFVFFRKGLSILFLVYDTST